MLALLYMLPSVLMRNHKVRTFKITLLTGTGIQIVINYCGETGRRHARIVNSSLI